MTIDAEGGRRLGRRSAPVSFESFYEETWRETVAVTSALCRDVAVAEELAQEAFLRAYGRWRRVQGLDRPDLWVRRVALNLAVSRFRRMRSEARALTRVAARGAGPQESVTSSPDVEGFWEALRSLPPRQAQAAALFYVDDRSIREIAQLLGCSEGTVKAHLHAARQRLRALLDHPDEGDDHDR